MQQMNSDFGVDVFDVDGSGGAKQAMVARAQKWFTRSPRLSDSSNFTRLVRSNTPAHSPTC